MDGARLFNAACALNVKAKQICQYADSVMFASEGAGCAHWFNGLRRKDMVQ